MRNQLTQRLAELRDELNNGQHMLNELDARREELTRSMLRIRGAVQVLEELLTPGNAPHSASTAVLPATEATLRRVVG